MKPLFVLAFLLVSNFFASANNIGNNVLSVAKDGYSLKIPYFRNYPLGTPLNDIRRAILVVHGTNRNGDDYYNNMIAAANDCPSALDYTLVLAPVFLTEDDINDHNLGTDYPYWSSGGWKSGSLSKNNASNPRPVRISSYEVADQIIQKLLDNFPNLEHITVTGHSAGGQFTQRYMACGIKLAEIDSNYPDVAYQGLVLNPSSYVYMDDRRAINGSIDSFAVPSTSCSSYNDYKFGLDNLYAYLSQTGVSQIRNWYQNRKVVYLLGANDNDPNSSSLDVSCQAMLQGAHRLERGIIFYNYLQDYFGNSITDTHQQFIVPGVGHSHADMFSSDIGKRFLFPCYINFQFSVYLEGAYSTGKMSSNLYSLGLFPVQQPYNISPWNYSGTEGDGFVLADYPPEVIDWVLVSLRSDVDPATEIWRGAGVLLEDAEIKFLDRPAINSIPKGDYYVVVEHRNHMGIMSPQTIPLRQSEISFDFRETNSYQVNFATGQKLLGNGVWGMLAGDFDSNDLFSYDINGMDVLVWQVNNGNFLRYDLGDGNFDGEINGADKTYWKNNSGAYSSVPK